MDNVVIRSRYPRSSTSTRKRKKSLKETGTYRDKLAKQMVISIMILMVAGIIKNANTTVTNYVSDKVKGVLSQNIELQSLYESVEDVVNKVLQKESSATFDEDFNEDAVSVNGGDYDQEDGEGGPSVDNNNAQSGAANDQAAATPVPGTTSNANISPAQPSTPIPGISKDMFITPVEGILSSPFGNRISPSTGKEQVHKGIDIEASQGADIKAAAAGEVSEAGYEKTLGNYLKIDHGSGMHTVYAHCSELLVKKGQKVKQSDLIAKVGNTGSSTGAHLHFEIWKDETALNPRDYIKVTEK